MNKHFPTYEVLCTAAKPENLTFLQKFSLWLRDLIEKAE